MESEETVNRYLAERMGVEWHEVHHLEPSMPMHRKVGCPCGWYGYVYGKHHGVNPNFFTKEGFWDLWEWAIKKEWWDGFCEELVERVYDEDNKITNGQFLKKYIDYETLPNLIYTYLKEKEG